MPDILAPTLEQIEALAQAAFDSLPEHFVRNVKDVLIRVEEFPDAETEREMELDSPFDILGLYRGSSIAGREGSNPSPFPDMIHLYRRPILDYWCETGEELAHVVRHVLIHEIGHHFGLSDDDMEAIERQMPD
ncbi:MAG: metallopeptidase family protein [Alphaproteobacteria bacterium]|nr:metallopeptidase family protein [Alphaproteobacteria bacterium]